MCQSVSFRKKRENAPINEHSVLLRDPPNPSDVTEVHLLSLHLDLVLEGDGKAVEGTDDLARALELLVEPLRTRSSLVEVRGGDCVRLRSERVTEQFKR